MSAGTLNSINMPGYFRSRTNWEAVKEASKILIKKIHNEYSDLFTGVGCCDGTFKLQVREDSCPYQSLP